jgi:hypothetical protein
MRKIDKTEILATAYHRWLAQEQAKPAPARKAYDRNASKFKFYYDIAMNLLYCQKGLCAYTEVQLCPEKYLANELWKKGKYDKSLLIPKPFNGELEHFDESLKETNGWLWDNFFMIDSDTNNRKGTKAIDIRLKPDMPTYNPFEIFDYSLETHRFIINTDMNITKDDRKNLQAMVDDVLGINFPNLVEIKRKVLTRRLKMLDFRVAFTPEEENQFPTAFAFCQQIMQKIKSSGKQ